MFHRTNTINSYSNKQNGIQQQTEWYSATNEKTSEAYIPGITCSTTCDREMWNIVRTASRMLPPSADSFTSRPIGTCRWLSEESVKAGLHNLHSVRTDFKQVIHLKKSIRMSRPNDLFNSQSMLRCHIVRYTFTYKIEVLPFSSQKVWLRMYVYSLLSKRGNFICV